MGPKSKMNAAILAATTLALSAPAAFAQDSGGWSGWWWRWWGGGDTGGGNTGGGSNAVPEIDAGAGLLAVAAVLATLALVWELRRRRQKQN
ncbi:VPEID-CTERM sorting domain-containing protein [Shimia sagamensis]|uniref:VPEID-CTERM protein sorting domain-containing protein n=1 Tax=Shimia sagamensis TaxID=1566352 RepID=A0ABY1P7A4_9RHOB|nr:VPEID-CTERM sorting domain-containing protein [Shimia sagamensis]SMP27358.1 VPEID-CTERM protein sorting domain-containing protein [Shimia sagamensis]